jgi:DNA-binding transcriptional LysR family regulator
MERVVKFQHNLTVRHLRLISILGRELSVGRCAEVLHTSQSAVSRGLAEIEVLLGETLFERTTRQFRPTTLGQNLIWHSEQILSQLDRAESEFKAIAKGESGILNVGIIGSFSPEIFAKAVSLTRAVMPGLIVRLQSNFADGLVVDLMRGRCDVALTHLDVREFGKDLVADVLYEDSIAVMAAKNHPLAHRKRVVWNELVKYGWALTPVQTFTRRTIERHLRVSPRQQLPVIVETMELHYVIELVRSAGFLTAMSSRLAGWFESAIGDIKRLPIVGDTSSAMCVAHLSSRKLSHLETLFIESLKTASQES